MLKNIYKLAFVFHLLLSINAVNAMNCISIEMNTLNKGRSQSNNIMQTSQNNTVISQNNEVSEEKQCEILMNLYRYSISKWKSMYNNYYFENDNLAYNKSYSTKQSTDNITQNKN